MISIKVWALAREFWVEVGLDRISMMVLIFHGIPENSSKNVGNLRFIDIH